MKYLIVIERTATGYSAYSPDVPGCIATDSTREAAEREMRDAIAFISTASRPRACRFPSPARRRRTSTFPRSRARTVHAGRLPVTHEQLIKRIVADPAICHERPCIRGHRIWVSLIVDLLADGLTVEQVLQQYPSLELDDVRACLV